MVNIAVVQPSSYGCTREVAKQDKIVMLTEKKPFTSSGKTAFVNFFSVLIQKPLQTTGCPNSSFLYWFKTFEKTLLLHEISKKC